MRRENHEKLSKRPLTRFDGCGRIRILRCFDSDCSLTIRIQRTDKCEHRRLFCEDGLPSGRQRTQRNLRCSRFEGKQKDGKFIFPLSIPAKSDKTEIELKSLILAQIERWRHALHMQVERQHGELALWWRVAHG